MEGKHLFTVCEEAHCPNRYECWNQGTATFMIAGERCTRACAYCAVKTAKPFPLDPEEPQHVADAVVHMKLRHAVITMVTRDDLPDGAAAHFAQVIRAVRKASPSTIIEVLASDLNEKPSSIRTLMAARPHIFGHNLETVERLTPIVRFRAQYQRSLRVLRMALDCVDGKVSTKSGIMLGLGETEDELFRSMDDLLEHGVTVLTLGQYLRPPATTCRWSNTSIRTTSSVMRRSREPRASGTWRPGRWSAAPTMPPISPRKRTCWRPLTKI